MIEHLISHLICHGRFLLIAFALAGILEACLPLSGYPPEPFNPAGELGALEKYFKADEGIVADYHKSTDPVTRKKMRDEVVYGRIRAYDINFKAFERALATDNNVFSIGTDLLVLGLNAGGATSGGASVKSALAAASAGIVGAKGAVDKDLFYQKTLPALLAEMEARRLAALVPIETGLAKPDADYSLDHALIDLSVYDTAGSIPGAISGIVKSAGVAASEAQQQIKLVRSPDFTANLEPAKAIGVRLKALTPAQALALAKAMEPHIAKRRQELIAIMDTLDPSKERLKDGAKAKETLYKWQVFDDRDATSMKQWTDALTVVEQM